ncbi:hypothetical protein H072_3981 [Dactylellina haptotyla CBS 200.50]|uniref:F-box domain-containing protein n=1 Tax=Dactylellina haptotyla (strain CBS 200.50) TaxID=1284197 RepID=S8AG82_DACHA|nr:hypothetical protein H072_3981 [Dactylellina haptotyla CBS 200.50]
MEDQGISRSGLLSLPRELRDEIYRYLLVFDSAWDRVINDGGDLRHDSHLDLWKDPPPTIQYQRHELSILRTCHQVYVEAAPIFYGGNTFPVHIALQLCGRVGMERRAPWVRVRHSTPWEELEFIYDIQSGLPSEASALSSFGKYNASSGLRSEGIPFKPETLIPSTLLERNGNLIRHLRVHCDLGHVFFRREARTFLGSYKKILLHIAARVHYFMPRATKVISLGCSEIPDSDLFKTFDGFSVDFLEKLNAALLELVAPLAKGKSRISTCVDANLIAMGIYKIGELRDGQEEASEAKIDRPEEIPLEEGCHWATVGGRLIVQPDEALL